MQNPMKKKEFCGADAVGTINREEFGVGWGKSFGFKMDVKLAIQVEAFIAS
jgi:polyisoprenoid-binding protein YceI